MIDQRRLGEVRTVTSPHLPHHRNERFGVRRFTKHSDCRLRPSGSTQGRACGLASVLGVALGNLSNALGAALGLAALFAVSSAAFTAVKWAGAAYLLYLGIRMWRTASPSADATPQALALTQPLRGVFRDGFMVALLNPKTTLFFAAFLPQFMHAHGNPLMQTEPSLKATAEAFSRVQPVCCVAPR